MKAAESPDPVRRPEADLIISILSQAISDLFGTAHSSEKNRDLVRREALAFLTQKHGGWANRRNELCSLIGIESDAMRSRVIRVLNGDTLGLQAYAGTGIMSNVDEARRMWKEGARHPTPHKEPSLRAPDPKPPRAMSAIRNYSAIHDLVYRQLEIRPSRFSELNIAFNGDVSDTVMRKVLKDGLEKGELTRAAHSWVYRLVPHNSVEAEAA